MFNLLVSRAALMCLLVYLSFLVAGMCLDLDWAFLLLTRTFLLLMLKMLRAVRIIFNYGWDMNSNQMEIEDMKEELIKLKNFFCKGLRSNLITIFCFICLFEGRILMLLGFYFWVNLTKLQNWWLLKKDCALFFQGLLSTVITPGCRLFSFLSIVGVNQLTKLQFLLLPLFSSGSAMYLHF